MDAQCSVCGRVMLQAADSMPYACPDCGGSLLLRYPDAPKAWKDASQPGLWKYGKLLPPVPDACKLFLGEGGTPLVKSRNLAKRLNIGELYFKLESVNPTGSYKDRIAAIGVSWAMANRRPACIGTTSGNAGAAFAAYAAVARMPYHLFVLEHMAEAKLAQVLAYNAMVRKVIGFGTDPDVGDRVFRSVLEAGAAHDWEVTVTAIQYNPYAMEGVKTIAYELTEQLPAPATHVYAPVGGGGLYCGIWKGFHELRERGEIAAQPQMVAVQSAGCSNIVQAYEAGVRLPVPGRSTSSISGLQVPNPPDGALALSIMARGDGSAVAVEDSAIWDAQRLLAEEEGILAEPAAAASLAGLIRECRESGGMPDRSVVCIISGIGFKDGQRLMDLAAHKQVPLLESTALGLEVEETIR